MPKVPSEVDIPNLDGETEFFWLRWIQEKKIWIPPSHWFVNGMGKTSNA
jgi:hypothetical protein